MDRVESKKGIAMKNSPPEGIGLEKLRRSSRRPVEVSPESLVVVERMQPRQPLPLVIRPAAGDLDLADWAGSNRELIETKLLEHAGILFRGFNVQSVVEFERLIEALYGELLEYHDRVQPRTQVARNVYTSTEYPADQTIELHNESAYAHNWPMRIFFYCMTPAEEGGETPLADCRKVFSRIDPATRQRFVEKQVMYLRNLGGDLGISWQTAFQTQDRAAMEEYCGRAGIQIEWRGGDRLRTRSVRPVVLQHPQSAETVWFNAAISAHESTLDPSVRETLLREFSSEGLPKNSFYGDGSPIEAEVLEEIRRACREETVTFTWQRGDVLLLDNMLAAHGRSPFRGRRKVVVGMARPASVEDF